MKRRKRNAQLEKRVDKRLRRLGAYLRALSKKERKT